MFRRLPGMQEVVGSSALRDKFFFAALIRKKFKTEELIILSVIWTNASVNNFKILALHRQKFLFIEIPNKSS